MVNDVIIPVSFFRSKWNQLQSTSINFNILSGDNSMLNSPHDVTSVYKCYSAHAGYPLKLNAYPPSTPQSSPISNRYGIATLPETSCCFFLHFPAFGQ